MAWLLLLEQIYVIDKLHTHLVGLEHVIVFFNPIIVGGKRFHLRFLFCLKFIGNHPEKNK